MFLHSTLKYPLMALSQPISWWSESAARMLSLNLAGNSFSCDASSLSPLISSHSHTFSFISWKTGWGSADDNDVLNRSSPLSCSVFIRHRRTWWVVSICVLQQGQRLSLGSLTLALRHRTFPVFHWSYMNFVCATWADGEYWASVKDSCSWCPLHNVVLHWWRRFCKDATQPWTVLTMAQHQKRLILNFNPICSINKTLLVTADCLLCDAYLFTLTGACPYIWVLLLLKSSNVIIILFKSMIKNVLACHSCLVNLALQQPSFQCLLGRTAVEAQRKNTPIAAIESK